MDRNKQGIKSGIVGIIANTILFLSKTVIGMLSGSVSIIADAINNLSDSISSLLTVVAYYLAGKPADKEHPYGHERFEYISGFVIAFIMLYLGIQILSSSFKNVLNAVAVEATVAMLCVLVLSILVKGWMYFYYRKNALKMDSEVLLANASDSRNDVLITSGILVGIGLNHFFNIKLDGYIGMAIAILIIVSAFGMLNEFISELLGERPDQEEIDSIVSVLKVSENIHGFHDLMIHNYGKMNRYAVVHVEVDQRLSLVAAHRIIHIIEENVFDATGINLDVHLDPLDLESPEIKKIVKTIKSALYSIHPTLSFHDTRIENKILSFEVVRDPKLQLNDDLICDIIVSHLKENNLDYPVDIHFDALDLLEGAMEKER